MKVRLINTSKNRFDGKFNEGLRVLEEAGISVGICIRKQQYGGSYRYISVESTQELWEIASKYGYRVGMDNGMLEMDLNN